MHCYESTAVINNLSKAKVMLIKQNRCKIKKEQNSIRESFFLDFQDRKKMQGRCQLKSYASHLVTLIWPSKKSACQGNYYACIQHKTFSN